MIDTTALIIAAFGTGSLVLSFVEYTLSRRKIDAATDQPYLLVSHFFKMRTVVLVILIWKL